MKLSSTALEILQNSTKQILTNEQIHQLQKPTVYVFVKSGEVLYVGVGQHGVGRALDANHHRASIRDTADEVHVFGFPTYCEAFDVERLLIRELRPPYNKALNTNFKRRGTKRGKYGEGSVFQRTDNGRWAVAFYDNNGRRRQQSFQTEYEARRALLLSLALRDAGKLDDPKPRTEGKHHAQTYRRKDDSQ